jgi:transposase
VLYLASGLSNGQWKLASITARGQAARLVSVPAGDKERLLAEIARAKSRFNFTSSAAVLSCYEVGPDGFRLHRYLHHNDINNVNVDSSSIEVDRRARRAKADPPLADCQPGRTARPLSRTRDGGAEPGRGARSC